MVYSPSASEAGIRIVKVVVASAAVVGGVETSRVRVSLMFLVQSYGWRLSASGAYLGSQKDVVLAGSVPTRVMAEPRGATIGVTLLITAWPQHSP
jgi:hypothetical protein